MSHRCSQYFGHIIFEVSREMPKIIKRDPYQCSYPSCKHVHDIALWQDEAGNDLKKPIITQGKPGQFRGKPGHPNKYCCHECYAKHKADMPLSAATIAGIERRKGPRAIYEHECQNPRCQRNPHFTTSRSKARKYCSIQCASEHREILNRNNQVFGTGIIVRNERPIRQNTEIIAR